ncbi:MAG TPA: 50S ribosomal protein L24 [Phycisphaerae bacterium]|nr:50S ribosomal protein L24 [Phycisphaerales bacterium]HNO76764.1 50S ribosomal protein L24 [Phycisphaerae bacterium]
MACHVKKNEIVEVISGAHRGAQGKVLHVDPVRELVLVEGVNVVFRHVRPNRRNPQGGRVEKEAAIHISNVLPVDTKTQKGSRVHFEVTRNSAGKVIKKERRTVGGTVIDTVKKVDQ